MISNILKMASSVIPLQTVSYKKFLSRSINDVGIEASVYDTPVNIKASVQPVSRSVYEQFGLDFQKSYVTIWTEHIIFDVTRDTSSDRIVYNGSTYQIPSNQGDWHLVNGYSSYLAVKID